MNVKDAMAVLVLVAIFLGCTWITSKSTRTMTLVCVKVTAEKSGLQAALEACR